MTIKQVENALLDALRTKFTYARKVDSYGGEWDEAINKVIMLFPVVLVELDAIAYTMLVPKGTEVGAFWEELTFAIWLGAKNLRGEEQARRGTQGAYQMLEDVKSLYGKVLTQGLMDLAPQGVEMMANSRGVAVYRALVSVRQKFATS